MKKKFLNILPISRFCSLIVYFAVCVSSCLFAEEAYRVEFSGVNQETTQVLQGVSQLVALQKDPPASKIALKRRAEADIPNLVQGLHSLGYFNAKVTLDIQNTKENVVFVIVDPGPVYPLKDFIVIDKEDGELLEEVSFDKLGIKLGDVALPESILDAESALLDELIAQGYPLAIIDKREVIADQETKTIRVILTVDKGPKPCFGLTTIKGLCSVHPCVIYRRLAWMRGQEYDPCLVSETECALDATGLFSSVSIQHGEELDEDGGLPLEIDLKEALHRTLGVGGSYNTYLGIGGTLFWENRNVHGRGRRLSFQTDVYVRKQNAALTYVVPDFCSLNQELHWQLELEKERTTGFIETFYAASATIHRKVNPNFKFSYGLGFKRLFSQQSDNNRPFTLLKVPVQAKWTFVDDVVDPHKGYTAKINLIPTAQIFHPQFIYSINQLIATGYIPFARNGRHVIAIKSTFGSITGPSSHTIPPPERFYAGSENCLRGYKYLTVSPLNDENKPIGGRSMMIYALEARFRVRETFGIVGFFDAGNVYACRLPSFEQKVLKSVGAGIRYYTPVGPLRADIAFPLDKRPGIDPSFQFYISIGQAF